MEYVCTGATLKCTMGTSCPKLKATPKNVSLTGKDQANIADYVSMKNVPSFGRCRSLAYPPTASATAANHGKLTPMPCVPGTCPKWEAIDKDSLICGEPALLKPATLKCMYGGTISIVDPGQTLEIKNGNVIKETERASLPEQKDSDKNTKINKPANLNIVTELGVKKNNVSSIDDIPDECLADNIQQSLDSKSLYSDGVVTGGASNVTEQDPLYIFIDGVMRIISMIDDKLNKPRKKESETISNPEDCVNDYLTKRFVLCTLNEIFNQVQIDELKADDIAKLGMQSCYSLSRFPSLIDPIRFTIMVAGYIKVINEKYFKDAYFGTNSTFNLKIVEELGNNCFRMGYAFKSGAGDVFENYHRMGRSEITDYAYDGILVREIIKGERIPKDLFINENKVKVFLFEPGDRKYIYIRLEEGKQYYIVAYIYIKGKEGRDGYMFSNVVHIKA